MIGFQNSILFDSKHGFLERLRRHCHLKSFEFITINHSRQILIVRQELQKIILLLPSSSVVLFGTGAFVIVVMGREDVIATTDSVVGFTLVDTELNPVMERIIKNDIGYLRFEDCTINGTADILRIMNL